MLFECSFHPSVTDFDDLVMMIDTVSVIPKDCKNEESLYSVECNQLGKVNCSPLLKWFSRPSMAIHCCHLVGWQR